ncbi:hypothetical protein [Flavisolibacter nicotianae]|uniref:hypothetical protein n=1 Tax=Flavisolibacter nicotianae TaxID=2364882 RepID=UPI0013C4D3E4|nr:hypothetical protein [Flavisolibacter nicotianae]
MRRSTVTSNNVMEVKMFVHNSPDAAEKALNDWLPSQKIKVCYVTQSQCEKQGRFVIVVSVFYEKQ